MAPRRLRRASRAAGRPWRAPPPSRCLGSRKGRACRLAAERVPGEEVLWAGDPPIPLRGPLVEALVLEGGAAGPSPCPLEALWAHHRPFPATCRPPAAGPRRGHLHRARAQLLLRVRHLWDPSAGWPMGCPPSLLEHHLGQDTPPGEHGGERIRPPGGLQEDRGGQPRQIRVCQHSSGCGCPPPSARVAPRGSGHGTRGAAPSEAQVVPSGPRRVASSTEHDLEAPAAAPAAAGPWVGTRRGGGKAIAVARPSVAVLGTRRRAWRPAQAVGSPRPSPSSTICRPPHHQLVRRHGGSRSPQARRRERRRWRRRQGQSRGRWRSLGPRGRHRGACCRPHRGARDGPAASMGNVGKEGVEPCRFQGQGPRFSRAVGDAPLQGVCMQPGLAHSG